MDSKSAHLLQTSSY